MNTLWAAIPSPPCQILTMSNGWSLKRSQSVATWYSRAPITPAGTAHNAIDAASSRVPIPIASIRRPNSHTPATTPRAIISP